MENQIMQKIKEINLKLHKLDSELDVAEYYGTYDLMPDEEEKINQEMIRLCALKEEKYSKLYEEKKKLFLNKLSNPKIRKILKMDYEESNHEFHQLIDYEFNYLFLNLIEKAPI